MRNIRILVEFASVVMPGAVLLLILTYTFAPHLPDDSFVGTGLGIVAGLVSSFALWHLLQAFSQAAVEPFVARVRLRTAADQAFTHFTEGERYLTVEQIGLLESQFPARLGIPLPAASDGAAIRDSALAHMEAYLYSAKVNERLDDLTADYKLNKGLFLSLAIGGLGLLGTGLLGNGHWALCACWLPWRHSSEWSCTAGSLRRRCFCNSSPPRRRVVKAAAEERAAAGG